MRGVVFSGGEIGSYEVVAKKILPCDFIVCADSGYLHAKRLGVKPHAVLGDFDSVRRCDVVCDCIVDFPPKKDLTDTELCIRYAIEQGCSEILLLGATGGRIDHELANLFLLKVMMDEGVTGYIFDGISETWLVSDKIVFDDGEAGDLLSVLPIAPQVTGITTEGLEYPLKEATLQFGPALGISNVFLGSRAAVRVAEGLILVVRTRKQAVLPVDMDKTC